MSADGAVLVDWTNSRWAERSLDVAITWVVLACFGPADPALEAAIRSVRVPMLNGFVAAVDRTAALHRYERQQESVMATLQPCPRSTIGSTTCA
jgi:hypothetical protein